MTLSGYRLRLPVNTDPRRQHRWPKCPCHLHIEFLAPITSLNPVLTTDSIHKVYQKRDSQFRKYPNIMLSLREEIKVSKSNIQQILHFCHQGKQLLWLQTSTVHSFLKLFIYGLTNWLPFIQNTWDEKLRGIFGFGGIYIDFTDWQSPCESVPESESGISNQECPICIRYLL